MLATLRKVTAGGWYVGSGGGRTNSTMTRAGARSSRSQRPLDSAELLAYQCASRSSMEAAKIYFIAFGVLTIAGGIVGYAKAGSMASIIAGSITGILLLVAAFL